MGKLQEKNLFLRIPEHDSKPSPKLIVTVITVIRQRLEHNKSAESYTM